MPVTLKDTQQAQRRIASGVWLSPCQESHELSRRIGARIFCKLDNLQHTGSFKERGARNARHLLSAAQRRRGAFAGTDVSLTHVVCTIETRDRAHARQVHRSLRQNGIKVFLNDR